MKKEMKPAGFSFRQAPKLLALAVIKILTAPTSYRYHVMLGSFLGVLNEKLAARCVSLFANNSKDQFASGAVYEYKDVVRYEQDVLKINLDLARARINEIFLNKEVLEYLDVSGKESLLEIGCEAGQNLAVIRESMPAMQLHGCDISRAALACAEKSGFFIHQIDLLGMDSLNAYGDNQVDYIVVSHVLEHLVEKDIPYTKDIRRNVLRHIHRIAKIGYVITTPLIASEPEPLMMTYLGHSRVALLAFPTSVLAEIGVSNFLVKLNTQDTSFSIIVRKVSPEPHGH